MATSNWKYADILADQRLEMLQDGNKELYDEEMERTRKVIESRLELGLDIDEQLAWADKVGYNYNLHNASVAGIDPENVSKTGYSDKLLAKVGKDDKSLISPSTKTLSENKPLTDSQITLGLIENSQKAAQNQKDNQYAQYQNYQKQLESMYEEYKKNAKNQAERIREISGVNPLKCMKWGKCSATCPAFNEMDIKPHQFVSYVANENIEELVKSESLWKCLSCFACVERYPRDVKPGKIIDAARQLVVRERGGNYLSADEIPELLDDETPQQLLVSAYRRYKR